MDREEILEIITRVVAEQLGGGVEESLEFPVEMSARHVHLTQEALDILFGKGKKLTPKRPLSQPGQFLCEERIKLVTPKGEFQNVAILGPIRSRIQVEISAADARVLGIQAPICMSGDLAGGADVTLIGPAGVLCAKESTIIAKGHIHMKPEHAAVCHVKDGEAVSVTLGSADRPVTFEDVIVRVSPEAGLAYHMDMDEANACQLPTGCVARLKRKAAFSLPAAPAKSVCGRETSTDSVASAACPSAQEIPHLITEAAARKLAASGCTLRIPAQAIVTPAALDVLRQAKVTVERSKGGDAV